MENIFLNLNAERMKKNRTQNSGHIEKKNAENVRKVVKEEKKNVKLTKGKKVKMTKKQNEISNLFLKC